jgi:hypothetical protein
MISESYRVNVLHQSLIQGRGYMYGLQLSVKKIHISVTNTTFWVAGDKCLGMK